MLSHNIKSLRMQNGLTQKACTRCNESSNIPTNALGHNFTNWKTIKKVTCTEDGKDSRACTRCNKEENKFLKLEQKSIKKLNNES